MFTMSESYRTNHVITLFGQDFSYLNAQKSFKNIDKLIKYVNERYTDIKVTYSTPYDYIQAVHKTEVALPVQYDDMLPYASAEHEYWTGYYTSRANFKSFVKYSSERFNTFSTCMALDSISKNSKDELSQLMDNYSLFYKQMGLVQHHDAVSGTAKKRVMDDYSHTLFEASLKGMKQFLVSFSKLHNQPSDNFEMCYSRNSSLTDCPTSKFLDPTVEFIDLHLLSPLRDSSLIPRIPLPDGNFTFENVDVQPDILCGGQSSTYAFIQADLVQGEEKIIRIRRDSKPHCLQETAIGTVMDMKHLSVQYLGENEKGESSFKLFNKINNITDTFVIDYKYYESFQNTSEAVSGAYLFRPLHSDGQPKRYNTVSSSQLFVGQHISILLLRGDQMATQVILTNINDFIRLESVLLGVPYTSQGMEVFLKLQSSSIKSEKTFYTDSMGLELQKRILNFRPLWSLNVTEPVAGNFYPVNSLMVVKDEQRALEVIPDRAQGASSLEDGEVQLMLQRRLYVDDNKGVDEALNETNSDSPDGKGVLVKAYTYFRIRGASEFTPANIYKTDLETPPYEVYSTNPPNELPNSQNALIPSLGLPKEIKLIVFPEQGSLFFRLENTMDVFDSQKKFTVNLIEIAESLVQSQTQKVISIEELSLTGIFTMKEMENKLKWKGEDFTSGKVHYGGDLAKVELEPQRIRSFRVSYSNSSQLGIKEMLS
jgi:lysosomal alpha-mannosidase